MSSALSYLKRPLTLFLVITLFGTFARARYIHRGLHDYHTWRQVDTAIIARNLYRHGMNIFFPETMWNGDDDSHVSMELPFYPWVVAAIYHVFGPNDVLGRAVSVAAYAASSYVLFLLCTQLWSVPSALWATLAFAIHPLGIGYTRTFQPESFMILFTLLTLLCWWKWSEGRNHRWAILGSAFLSLAALLKLPSLYLGVPVAFLLFKRLKWRVWREPISYVSLVLCLAPVAAWWYHCYDFPAAFIRFWEPGTGGKWGGLRLWLSDRHYLLWAQDIPTHMIYKSGLVFFLMGWTALNRSNAALMVGWTIGIAVYILGLTEAVLGPEEYYQLPLVPLIAAWIGGGAGALWSASVNASSFGRKPLCILLFVWMLCESWTQVREFYHEQVDQDLLRSAVDATRRHVGPNDLVIWDSTYGFPELFYHADRRGWKLFPGAGAALPTELLGRTSRDVYAVFSAASPEQVDRLLLETSDGRDLLQYPRIDTSGPNAIFALRTELPEPLVESLDSQNRTFPSGARFDYNGVMLRGTGVNGSQESPPFLKTDFDATFDFYWQWEQVAPEEVAVEIQLRRKDRVIFSDKHVVLKGRLPMSEVKTGAIYHDRAYVRIPWDLAPGEAELRLGLCRTSGSCFPVVGEDGSGLAPIGSVKIQDYFDTPRKDRFP